MKIDDKTNFLKSHFLIMGNKPPNINIPYKYANLISFFYWFLVFFVLTIFKMINIHKNKKI